jgi:hypothetical protein
MWSRSDFSHRAGRFAEGWRPVFHSRPRRFLIIFAILSLQLVIFNTVGLNSSRKTSFNKNSQSLDTLVEIQWCDMSHISDQKGQTFTAFQKGQRIM